MTVETMDVPTVTKILGSVGPHHVEALKAVTPTSPGIIPDDQVSALEEVQAVVCVLSNINVIRAKASK